MKLIVGLGNPGEEYKNNRHNVGFMFADFLVMSSRLSEAHGGIPLNTKRFLDFARNDTNFKMDSNFQAEVCKAKFNNKETLVIKPQTFMNRSGESIAKIMNYYKISVNDLYVAHDDLDIPLGKYKIQKGVGPKLHNGLLSIEEKLGNKDFLRIRIGVENRAKENYLPGEAYVLHDFTPNEKEIINKVFNEIYSRIIKI